MAQDDLTQALNIANDTVQNVGQFSYDVRSQERYEQLVQEGRDWNLDMWNRQNEYNSPRAQVQRLIDAGLNPNLAYGQLQNFNPSTPRGQQEIARQQYSQLQRSRMMEFAMNAKQMSLIQSQEEVNAAVADKEKAIAEHQEIVNTDARDKIERDKQTWKSNLDEAKARIDKFYSDIGVNLYIKDNYDSGTALKRLEHFFKSNTMGLDEEYKRSLNAVNWSKIARDSQEIALMVKRGEEIDVNIVSRILHDYIDLGSNPYSADIGNVLYGSLVYGYDYDDATLDRVIHAINEDESKQHNAWKMLGLSAFAPLLNGFDRDLNIFTEKVSKGKVNKEDLKKVIEALKKVPVKGKTFKGGPLKTLM